MTAYKVIKKQNQDEVEDKGRRIAAFTTDTVFLECHNGTFIGKAKDGIEEYRGIPFALPPVGTRRWRAPVPAPESKEVFEAFKNGKSPIQTECQTERASFYEQGEDCLYLNIWMGSREKLEGKRPVMVFLHGGAFGWGGTADPLYNGTNFVKAHPEVILITVAYRTGIMGFIDLSYLRGGEAFPDAPNLGILDQIEALHWIRRNCEAFDGDADNITVFGESAGAASVMLLPVIPKAKGLFRRVIAESGSTALTYSQAQCKDLTDRLIELTGAKDMKQLMALSEAQLKELNESLNDYANFPQRDGKLIPVNPYQSYMKGKSRSVDILIGTNADEANYWIGEVGGIVPFRFSIPIKFENDVKEMDRKDKHRVKTFMRSGKMHSIFRMSEFYTETMFRLPAIFEAGEHASNGGRCYMYYWTVPSAIPYYGACHAVELSYVFGNTKNTIFTGEEADPVLSEKVQQMWVSFAKYGDPSIPGLYWPAYDKKKRATMILSYAPHVEKDPRGHIRKLLYPLIKYRINPSYTNLDLNTHFVRRTASIGIILAGGLVVGGALLIAALVKKRK